jgi:hypothetical protein
MSELYEEVYREGLSYEEREHDELMRKYLENEDYHLKNWEKSKSGKSKINGIALIFGPYWLLFKGMVLYYLMFMAGLIGLAFFIPEGIINLMIICSRILLGIYGNKIYYHCINKRIKKVQLSYSDNDMRFEMLSKQKNRNFKLGILIYVCFIAFVIWGQME